MIAKQQGNLYRVAEIKQVGDHTVAEVTIAYSDFDKQLFLPISAWNEHIGQAQALVGKNVEVEYSVKGGQWNEQHQRAWPKLTIREIREVQPQQYMEQPPVQMPQQQAPPVQYINPAGNVVTGPAPTTAGLPPQPPQQSWT